MFKFKLKPRKNWVVWSSNSKRGRGPVLRSRTFVPDPGTNKSGIAGDCVLVRSW